MKSHGRTEVKQYEFSFEELSGVVKGFWKMHHHQEFSQPYLNHHQTLQLGKG